MKYDPHLFHHEGLTLLSAKLGRNAELTFTDGNDKSYIGCVDVTTNDELLFVKDMASESAWNRVRWAVTCYASSNEPNDSVAHIVPVEIKRQIDHDPS